MAAVGQKAAAVANRIFFGLDTFLTQHRGFFPLIDEFDLSAQTSARSVAADWLQKKKTKPKRLEIGTNIVSCDKTMIC